MEWIETLTQVISNLGFPIVCCGALFWYVVKHTEKQNDEIDKLSATVEQNTEILKELKTLISAMVGMIDGKGKGN